MRQSAEVQFMKLLRDCQRQPGSRVLRLKGAAGDPAVGRYARAILAMDQVEDGGPGSGNHGHSGRPGQRGGSAKGSGYSMKAGKPVSPVKAEKTKTAQFVPALQRARDTCNPESAWRVDTYRTAKDFDDENISVYSTAGGSTFAIKPDGDIISVCKNQVEDKATNARALMAAAVEAGGTHLDSYDGNWGFYTKCGFEVVSRCKFDPQYAPPGWDASRDKKEDVVFMRYVGAGNVQDHSRSAMQRRVPYSASYEEAEKILKQQMNGGNRS